MPDSGSDQQWITDTVERLEGRLIAYTTRRLRGNRSQACDIVQEAFCRLCDQSPAKQEKIREKPAPWLYTVCRNLTIDFIRSHGRMRQLGDIATRLEPDRGPGPRQNAETRDELSAALQLVDQLPENQQEALRLRFGDGLSYREIAEITDQTTGTVGYLIHAGIHTLREQMATDAPTPS